MNKCALFGERLKSERKRLSFSQEDFAGVCGVSKRAQANYEASDRAPDLRYLELAASVGCDVNFVVTGRRSAVQVQALQDCVEIVEEVLSELGRSLTPLQKAKVLTVLYEEYLEDSDSITPERIVRHLRLVA